MSKHTRELIRDIEDHPFAVLIVAVLGICLGMIFILSQADNKPIPRQEAVGHHGLFDRYETAENYCVIYFTDGTEYDVYPHTESRDFHDAMNALTPGTPLFLMVNPNNDYVVEVKTDREELLNFEDSQAAIDSYDNGYIAIGIVACLSGIFLIFYVIFGHHYKKKEALRKAHKKERSRPGENTPAIRSGDTSASGKILLEANTQGYTIVYRRIKFVNELVVNGQVYDEKKGFLEFEHALSATIDGHTIEAGYDRECFSYITFDGKLIKRKKRLF